MNARGAVWDKRQEVMSADALPVKQHKAFLCRDWPVFTKSLGVRALIQGQSSRVHVRLLSL